MSHDSELISILQRNELYDDLYKILNTNQIGLLDLRDMKQDDIDLCCKECKFKSHQTKQLHNFCDILHGNTNDSQYQMNMIVIGDKNSGKTSLIQRYVLGEMMESQYNHRQMTKTEKLSDDSLVNITILDGSAVTLRKKK
eukprot:379978_1